MSDPPQNSYLEETPVTRANVFAAGESWKKATGRGVRVGIVDSGVDTSHAILQGRVKESFVAKTEAGGVAFERNKGGDSAGHGTACAGIISAVAPDAELVSIKVLGAKGVGDGHPFLAGLEFAIQQQCRVINLSLGTTKPQFADPLRDLLDRGYRNGSVIVAAANNLPKPSYPSVFSSSLISVSKSTEKDPFRFGFRFGDVIELTAPGVDVRTAWLNGSYKNLTGNSFACPQIVGVIALLLETYPDLTPFQVKTLLYSIAKKNQVLAAE